MQNSYNDGKGWKTMSIHNAYATKIILFLILIIEISLFATTFAPAKPIEEVNVSDSNLEAFDEPVVSEFGTDKAKMLVDILALLWDEIVYLDDGLLLYSYYDGQLVYLTEMDDTIGYLYFISPLSYYYYRRR
jgi:hypothetical protein